MPRAQAADAAQDEATTSPSEDPMGRTVLTQDEASS